MYIVPAHVFTPDPVQAGIAERVISGGTAINGEETVIQPDGGGRWEITWGEIDLDDRYRQRLWDAWQAEFAGGANRVLVPVLSLDTAPHPIAAGGLMTPSDIVADDDWFPTEVGFSSPYIEAETVGAAPLRATEITINVTRGARLTPGMTFGIGKTRAHKIRRITSVTGQVATCIISPPLRAPVDDATPLNFDWPTVQCRAVIGQNLIPNISLGLHGTISVQFVEDFTSGE